ncbi:sushi domain-containing protein 2-like isoform X1 [Haliotis rufescens]|uniref:sushi domain-containing protein 2-like isoform X1 n=1 Tax=Haliotis rufescens TaxID=6454 RepID=UPI00201FA86F|nr:sushi domain-containing protein 2-like isoform X1 [Haliotis rufescens]
MSRIFALICLLQFSAGQIPSPKLPLYPYGSEAGDQLLETDSNLPLYLGYNVNFYGRKYNTAYVTEDGFVGFDANVKYEHFIFKDGARDVNLDFPFLAPFYFDGEHITNEYQGNIYYRLVFTNSSQSFLTELQYYMLNATVGTGSFVPDLALVVTWENVTDKSQVENGPCTGIRSNPCKSATFQLVLVACPMHTFVIFNYLWEDVPYKPYYQAGINGGHGVGWTPVCTGCSPQDLPRKIGSDVTGRFIFRVSKDTIERGGCSDSRRDLQILPTVVGMLGGELLDISGPCMDPDVAVVCRFGSGESAVTSQGFRFNSMRLKCPVPRLTQRGSVTVAVSTDGAHSYLGQADIYVVLPAVLGKSLSLPDNWYSVTADSLTMSWDSTALSTDPGVKVDIRLIGYSETDTNVNWKVLTTFATGTDNSGTYTITPSQYQCFPSDCDVFEAAVVEVELQKEFISQANNRTVMNSGPIATGWYINSDMTRRYGDDWPQQRCMQWYNADRQSMDWLDQLLNCPCNVDQALADFGRFQTDLSCSMFSKSPTICYYHREAGQRSAAHCVRSIQPTSAGAGNQCCYDKDGILMNAADTYQGSTPDRSHDWGAAPYNTPGHVPSFSHWIKDVASFYYCCLWTKYSHCNYYMDQRATRDCNGYNPPKAAIAFGDPHITTFDGKLYNFGGKGDFYLVKSDQFSLQGKFDLGQQLQVNRTFNATVLTSVAMSDSVSSGTTVEIHLAPSGLNSGRGLDVFVNKKIKLFNQQGLFKQDFEGGVTVVNVAIDPDDNRHDNFTVILKSGVGVQVAAANRLLHVIVNMPPNFKNRTQGLMGTWNGVVEDDFTPRSGNNIDIASSPQIVYQQFAKTWKAPNVESMFKNPTEADDSFVPSYNQPQIPSGAGFSRVDLDHTCGDNAQCRFDYTVTGNRDIANATKMAAGWFSELQSFQRPVLSCGLPDVTHASKDNYNYSVGNTVTLTGCRNGGSLSGDTTYVCSADFGDPKWMPAVSAQCSAASDDAGIGPIIGIVVGVVAAIVIIVIIVVVIVKRRKNTDRKESKKGEPEVEEGQKDAMMSDLKKRESNGSDKNE